VVIGVTLLIGVGMIVSGRFDDAPRQAAVRPRPHARRRQRPRNPNRHHQQRVRHR